jgi:hypothetical protein
VSGWRVGDRGIGESITAALVDTHPSWVTLPADGGDVPDELRAVLAVFDAGKRPAANAAADWLKSEALRSWQTARTRLLIADSRVAGFYSLASAHVVLSQRDRRRLGVTPPRVPAALVAWIAKDARAKVDGKSLLLHAAATARRVDALQATAVLAVDPFDQQTAMMWRQRFGFRSSSEPADRRRLWLPLRAVS